MLRMPFLMVNRVRRFTCRHHLGILFLTAWSAVFVALYGLKQAPHAWFERFASMVTATGFLASAHDTALFVHLPTHGRTLLLLYVDDMIITGDDPEYIAFVKASLSEQFLMFDLWPSSLLYWD
jgi:hypothetical protein